MNIEIFTGPNCAYCAEAKYLLSAHGLTFTERDVNDPSVLSEFRERLPRHKSLPQIFIDDIHVGGCENLRLRLKSATKAERRIIRR